MDSTRPESLLFSPSLKKSHRSRTPGKTTPSRLYLRQSFPTLESPTSTTPSISPRESFNQRLFRNVQEEQEREHSEGLQKDKEQLKNHRSQHLLKEAVVEHSSNSQVSMPASSTYNQHAHPISETLAKISDQGPPPTRKQPLMDSIAPKSVPAIPRLRTTETEYDLSPIRSTRLSTPPRSLYTGTPSKAFLDSWDTEGFQDSDLLASPPLDASPSDRYSRNRKARMMKTNSQFNQGYSLEDGFTREQHGLSPRYTIQDDLELEGFVDITDDLQESEYEDEYDDRGYNYGDEEVSFKRSERVLSSNQSTLVERDSRLQEKQLHSPQDNSQDQDYSDPDDSPIREHVPNRGLQSESRIIPQHDFVSGDEAENSLLEVAERTTTIAEELRGVYSNLQEFFSPETEAKLNGAVSVLSSQKSSSGRRHAAEINEFSASIPKPLIFEMSPVTVQSAPIITKRKPAPLRSALIPKHNRTPSPEQRQPQQNRKDKKQNQHDITLRGLISDAESARRLNQNNSGKHTRRSPDIVQESKSSKIRETIPVGSNFDTEGNGEKHQQHFRKKLDRWKRVELQNQYEAPPLPTYSDLYIPTTSSRAIINTDTEPDDDDLQLEQIVEERRTLPRSPDQIYKDVALQDISPQVALEKERRERKGKRIEQAKEEDLDLIDQRRLSKRRREAAFWS
ncbi:hypothetical protein BGX27_006999 [Mortierella sp. AM989]|nr:hypothetical protein BGX27_006999 [Mortierella sp. AM989]